MHLTTYLTALDSSIYGFRLAVTHPSRRLCFLRTYISWSHESMRGLFVQPFKNTDFTFQLNTLVLSDGVYIARSPYFMQLREFCRGFNDSIENIDNKTERLSNLTV